MKPMLPTLQFAPPKGEGWSYETKFDGYRCLCTITSQEIFLISRNGKTLKPQFPEIEQFIKSIQLAIAPFLPIVFDGEIVILENEYKADFGALQKRGRMRSEKKIEEETLKRPCKFLIFDLLILNGRSTIEKPYIERKKTLNTLFQKIGLPIHPSIENDENIQLITSKKDFNTLWNKINLYDGEGIVAKRDNSIWEEGKRTHNWIKYKNWKMVSCFVIAYEKENGYFYVAIYKDKEIIQIGHVLFGFNPEEKQTLAQIMKQNKKNEDAKFIYSSPGICLEIKYLEWYEGQLREPHFHQFLFNITPNECTYENFYFQQKNLPSDVQISHPDKVLWENPLISKMEYIFYLREISPFMLPYLRNRALTVIRYPHGLFGEPFYQKNCPEYAPNFIDTFLVDDINFILCNDLKSLVWLGNQLAIEYHIPFQTVSTYKPSEIVFDLDPPSEQEFLLAIKAAQLIKSILDQLNLTGFIKTSGSKGLQIHIPLDNTFSYDDTRLFTSFIADYLVSKEPELFTIERMKKKRGNRLYVDYVQHAEGKTIIAPYSARGRKSATVATPIFWDEVNENLKINQFTIRNTVDRVIKLGCPFNNYFKVKDEQPFGPVLGFLKQNKKF